MNHHSPSDARLFLLSFYVDRHPDAPTADAWQQRVDDFNDWARAVETRGEMVLAETVNPGSTTTWVRASADDPTPGSSPDHATAEATDRVLAGLCVVRVRDLDSAIELARRAPPLGSGASTGIRALHPA